jgi:hypothetical protein
MKEKGRGHSDSVRNLKEELFASAIFEFKI